MNISVKLTDERQAQDTDIAIDQFLLIRDADFSLENVLEMGQFASNLADEKAFTQLDKLVGKLSEFKLEVLKELDLFRKALIALKFEQKLHHEVYSLLEEGEFQDTTGLITIWDEAHYQEREMIIGKPLTTLTRFRVRKRYPPPRSILPSGVRPTKKLPRQAKEVLLRWLKRHIHYPYPNTVQKAELCSRTGLTTAQVKTFYANTRRRIKVRRQKIAVNHASKATPTTNPDQSEYVPRRHHLEISTPSDSTVPSQQYTALSTPATGSFAYQLAPLTTQYPPIFPKEPSLLHMSLNQKICIKENIQRLNKVLENARAKLMDTTGDSMSANQTANSALTSTAECQSDSVSHSKESFSHLSQGMPEEASQQNTSFTNFHLTDMDTNQTVHQNIGSENTTLLAKVDHGVKFQKNGSEVKKRARATGRATTRAVKKEKRQQKHLHHLNVKSLLNMKEPNLSSKHNSVTKAQHLEGWNTSDSLNALRLLSHATENMKIVSPFDFAFNIQKETRSQPENSSLPPDLSPSKTVSSTITLNTSSQSEHRTQGAYVDLQHCAPNPLTELLLTNEHDKSIGQPCELVIPMDQSEAATHLIGYQSFHPDQSQFPESQMCYLPQQVNSLQNVPYSNRTVFCHDGIMFEGYPSPSREPNPSAPNVPCVNQTLTCREEQTAGSQLNLLQPQPLVQGWTSVVSPYDQRSRSPQKAQSPPMLTCVPNLPTEYRYEACESTTFGPTEMSFSHLLMSQSSPGFYDYTETTDVNGCHGNTVIYSVSRSPTSEDFNSTGGSLAYPRLEECEMGDHCAVHKSGVNITMATAAQISENVDEVDAVQGLLCLSNQGIS